MRIVCVCVRARADGTPCTHSRCSLHVQPHKPGGSILESKWRAAGVLSCDCISVAAGISRSALKRGRGLVLYTTRI